MTSITRDAVSLLLYLETRAVDHAGLVDSRHMSGDDFDLVNNLEADGYVAFGRRPAKSFIDERGPQHYLTHWVRLLPRGWKKAHRERRAKAERTISAEA